MDLADLFTNIARAIVESHLDQLERVGGFKTSHDERHLLKCSEVEVREERGGKDMRITLQQIQSCPPLNAVHWI